MPSELDLTWDAVLSWRMERHLLDRPAGVDPAAVVERLAGVQAQVASSAAQAIAERRAQLGQAVFVSRPQQHRCRRDHAAAGLHVPIELEVLQHGAAGR